MDDRSRPEEGPYQEAENSTVDDWHGQKLAGAQERADRAMAEAGGDLDAAEAKFDEDSEQRS